MNTWFQIPSGEREIRGREPDTHRRICRSARLKTRKEQEEVVSASEGIGCLSGGGRRDHMRKCRPTVFEHFFIFPADT